MTTVNFSNDIQDIGPLVAQIAIPGEVGRDSFVVQQLKMVQLLFTGAGQPLPKGSAIQDTDHSIACAGCADLPKMKKFKTLADFWKSGAPYTLVLVSLDYTKVLVVSPKGSRTAHSVSGECDSRVQLVIAGLVALVILLLLSRK